jgi:hypothetical protein
MVGFGGLAHAKTTCPSQAITVVPGCIAQEN